VYIEEYRKFVLEERNLKKKILILLVGMALLVGILSGCVEETTTPTNNAPVVSVADPVIDHNTSLPGGTVTFNSTATDADEDDTLTYAWDFGDEVGNSTEEDPTYEYAANGTYTVILIVSDGTDTATWTDDIVIGNVGPTADFTYEATNLSVNFTDASTDEDTLTYMWDFGDEIGNSTEANPTYEYAAAGSYNVTLTVTDMYGLTDSYTEEITVTE
jgi:PKD repeat protein